MCSQMSAQTNAACENRRVFLLPTTWTVFQNDDPNHLGLRCNAFPEHQMALIPSGCVPFSPPTSVQGRAHLVMPPTQNMDYPLLRWP